MKSVSIKTKIVIPIMVLTTVFLSILIWQMVTVYSSLQMLRVINDKYITTLTKAEELKLSVVQVQQWLTDISATRAADGFDDGFEQAESYAQNVKTLLIDLTELNPEQKAELDVIAQRFEPYYETGKQMAQAYIEGGAEYGNQLMDEFDKTAEAINTSVDEFKEKSAERIATSVTTMESAVQRSIVMLIVSLIVMTFINVSIYLFISKAIVSPIRHLERELDELANNGGDLTQHINIRGDDEIGKLGVSVNRFIANLREIMIEVNNNADQVTKAATSVFQSLNHLNANIAETSVTIEELSAGMEETSAAAEEVTASSIQIESYIQAMTEKAQEGTRAADEIKMRAADLKLSTLKSLQTAREAYDEAKVKLEAALAQTSAIEKINVLSDTILQIASRTNLLALNASIEAARAGESGRGFAVVAEEIRKLAEGSKAAVSEIQSAVHDVVASVENLATSARMLIKFMDENVSKDYQAMLHTGEQYSDDATFISDLISEISITAEELNLSVQEIVRAMSEVAETVDRGATGTQNIVEKTTEIVNQVTHVHDHMQTSMESAQKLKDTVGKFTV